MDGQTYANDWSVVTAKKPSWIIIDGWNDFERGSEVCRTSEYGLKYVDATAVQIARLRIQKEYDAKILRHDAPVSIAPGGICQVTLFIKNDGMKPWRAAEGYALGYSWFKDGRPYQEGLGARPIQTDLLPGQAGEVTVGVVAAGRSSELGQENKIAPLPPGDYELFFEMMRLPDNKRFTELGDEPFVIPIRVGGAADRGASILSVIAPTMVQGGWDYPVSARVRNDGAATWRASEVKLTARLFRTRSYTRDAEDLMEPVGLAFTPTPLGRDVPSGETAEITAVLSARDSSGSPLPSWKPEDQWSYLLRWELADTNGTLATYDQVLDIFDRDMGAAFIDCDLPSSIPAGKAIDIRVVLRNNGTEIWNGQTHAIGTHWYYLDGVEALWDGDKTPLKEQIKPGEVRIVTVRAAAPAYDGLYRLVLDMTSGGRWGSTEPLTHGGDILQRLVSVTGGRLVFADLSRLYDVDVTSPDTAPKDGDFDGQGHSLPEEVLPPLVADTKADLQVYPSGCWWSPEEGAESERRISFQYPPKAAGAKNAVSCAGQTVPVPQGRYRAVHLLAAADSSDAKGALLFSYPMLTGTARFVVSAWNTEPRNGEKVGFAALHRHSAEGNEPGVKCYLHHVVVEADPGRELSAIELPKNPSIKILAITLEKAG